MTRDGLLEVIKAHAICNGFTLREVRSYAPGVQMALDQDGDFTLYFDRSSVVMLDRPMLGEQGSTFGVPDSTGYIVLDATHQTGVTWEVMVAVARQCVRPRNDRWHTRHITMFPE